MKFQETFGETKYFEQSIYSIKTFKAKHFFLTKTAFSDNNFVKNISMKKVFENEEFVN